MSQATSNIFASLPNEISDEIFETIATGKNIKIERIISQGHSSPATGWYDQSEHEWVIVLTGAAKIELENQKPVHLVAGSYLNIPAHSKHKVAWTDPDTQTVWLAIHYS
ncbi:MAG TPA: cupin domain-containing protein [Thiopseudomonas sp.]|nr:cupin domain-containing protein [Thiopseudomonas sp.]